MQNLVHLYHEIGMLAHTPRSGFAFLGSGKQSVAEHSHRMTLIAYTLATMSKEPVDIKKLLLMCLFHDFAEARTGDLNYVNKIYGNADEAKVINEFKVKHSFGPEIVSYLYEYIENKSIEAHLAHDADSLELMLVLKEQHDLGNARAMNWFDKSLKRLHTDTSRKLAEIIRKTPTDEWWRTELDKL